MNKTPKIDVDAMLEFLAHLAVAVVAVIVLAAAV